MVRRREFLVRGGSASAATFCALPLGVVAQNHSGAASNSRGPDNGTITKTTRDQSVDMATSGDVLDPTYIDPLMDSRSVSPENPTGGRGAGGRAGGGRKGQGGRTVASGERAILLDTTGPGTVRHIWIAYMGWTPEIARAQRLEVFYDGLLEPSVSVPLMDFFGLPHGRRAEFYSALISVNEGLGLNSHIPMPFWRSIRVELVNESHSSIPFDYQIDYTLESVARASRSYLHATFRRENPTVLGRDFVIFEGLQGPGRFLGCSVGIRVLDRRFWYGEGEVKMYRDGDRAFPTYCGTGLEDYVGSAQNLGRHCGSYSGAPINIPARADAHREAEKWMPVYASFYRWHLPDPIMFSESLRVTIQQIGAAWFKKGQEAEFEGFKKSHPSIEWSPNPPDGFLSIRTIERSDDYCATAYVYCKVPQPVPRYKAELAVADTGLLPFEQEFNEFMSDL